MINRFLISIILNLVTVLAMNGMTGEYSEPVDTSAVDTSGWNVIRRGLSLSWVSDDFHYRRFATPPGTVSNDTTVRAWRGERIGLEALIVSRKDTGPLKVELSQFTDSHGRVTAMPGSGAMFMRYVWTNDVRACGYFDNDTIPAYTVADMIDIPGTDVTVQANSVRPVWCTIEVPRDIAPGRYSAMLSMTRADGRKLPGSIRLNIEVLSHTLPAPRDYAFYLDLWQQPYAVSRYYGVEPWSEEHLRLLAPYAAYMARAGQKAVTTVLFYEPWGEQSNDKFEPMVDTVLEPDGTWTFDYTVFDRYVEFMARHGIDRAIECFTMVPWQLKFCYYDRAAGEYRYLDAPTSSPQYRELWNATLRSLENHLREKGWFEKTYIFMDERGLDQMLDALEVALEAVPDFRIGLAGDYHEELVDRLDSYTLGRGSYFSDEELQRRRDRGMVSLRYTCCSQPSPSQFSNNDPADGTYLPVYSTATGYDGYLHWSFQNWNDDPMTDTRWRMFGPGDTFFIYPDGRSSVRYERFVEGVQMSEKIRCLREEMTASGDTEGLQRLETALDPIRNAGMEPGIPTATIIGELRTYLNSYF